MLYAVMQKAHLPPYLGAGHHLPIMLPCRYDPLRNVLSDAAAPSAAHKYDMLRGLLRSSNNNSPARQRPAAPAVAVEGQQQQEGVEQRPADSKYDLLYDLLRSLKTAGGSPGTQHSGPEGQ